MFRTIERGSEFFYNHVTFPPLTIIADNPLKCLVYIDATVLQEKFIA